MPPFIRDMAYLDFHGETVPSFLLWWASNILRPVFLVFFQFSFHFLRLMSGSMSGGGGHIDQLLLGIAKALAGGVIKVENPRILSHAIIGVPGMVQ